MEAILYLPYAVGDPVKGFRYDDPTFTDKKYIQIMTDDYNKYKDAVSNIVYNNFDRTRNVFSNSLMYGSRFKIKRNYVKQEYQYNSCHCLIKNIKGADENIDNLIKYYKTGEQFVVILKLKDLSSNPDMETDMKMWLKESNHINHSNRLTEEEKIYNLPVKDFKVSFLNSKSSAIFKECKIIEGYNSSEYAILVNKIIFIVDK